MKNFLVTLIGVLLFVSCSQNNEEQAILDILDEQQASWNSGDINGFMKCYWKSDSLKFVGKNGIKYGWQTTLDNYKKSYPDKFAMGTLSFKVVTLEVEKESAFMLGKWHLQRENDTPNGYFTLYWKKINGQWLITIDHSS